MSEKEQVIRTSVRAGYCLECRHKAFEHEIAMNTPQTGRCLVAECGCMSLDTPSRDDLGDEVERLLTPTNRKCTWTEGDPDDSPQYYSDCGASFDFNDDGVEENGFKFCYRCGNPIEVKPFKETR